MDTTNSINYAVGSCSNGAASPTTGTCYAPQGALSQIQNGTNLVSTYLFNVRLQPCWMYATTGTALATSTSCTATDPGPGNILDLQYNFNSGHDNGNVIGITNNRDTTRTQNFTYDQVNRIVSAAGSTYSQSSAHCWGETYTYDQWANMSAIGSISSSYTGCVQDSLSVSVTTNNQLSSTGFSYDAAGNMLTDNVNTYAWNAESEMKSAAGVTYTYDGDGNRLEKSSGKIYWYGAGTEILDESDLSGNFTNEYVFFGGRRVAIRNVSSGTIDYYEEDMLGSSRTLVQAGATSPCFDADFLPFGYEKDVTTTCSQNYKFEGKERDTETSNDDFGARYYTFRLGRWLSADWSSVPAPVPYANLTNPQTLNLYAMVSDNPESFSDLTGHCGTGAPSEPCHDVHGHGPASVQGEPGSSGIAGDENSGIPDWYLSEVSAASEQKAAQAGASQNSSGKGFWGRLGHGLSNLFHGHSWNYVKTSVAVSYTPLRIFGAKDDVLTAGTDAAGLAATATGSIPLGVVAFGVSVANDHDPQNVITGALGLLPGFDWAFGITGPFVDLFDYGIHHTQPGVQMNGKGAIFDDSGSSGHSNVGGLPLGTQGGGVMDPEACKISGEC